MKIIFSVTKEAILDLIFLQLELGKIESILKFSYVSALRCGSFL